MSILVPARNEEATIAGCLRSLLAQDYPNLEILVLDDGSADATPDIVRPWAALPCGCCPVPLCPPAGPGRTGPATSCPGRRSATCSASWIPTPPSTGVRGGGPPAGAPGRPGLVLAPGQRRSVSGSVLLPMVPHAMFALFPMAVIHRPTAPGVAVAFGPFLLSPGPPTPQPAATPPAATPSSMTSN